MASGGQRGAVALFAGSALFWLVLAVSLVTFAPLVVAAFWLPFPVRYGIARSWSQLNLWWLRTVCGVRWRVEGQERLPDEPAIVFCKHQSAWETMAMPLLIPPQSWVLKRELMWLPFFGWGLALLKPIAIDRSAGRRAVDQLVEQGRRRLDEGLWVIIFPEGTRIPPGRKGRYKIGGAVLAARTGRPVVPIAHNAGEFWPRRGFIKRPGTVRVVIGPPIPSEGREPAEILADAEAWIEARMDEITSPEFKVGG